MSLYATLSTALSGLSTAQRALAVTANNVANANTAGYTRKVTAQEAVIIDGRGAGTRALSPERVVDEFLETELREQKAALGRSTALAGYHDRIQDSVLGAPGDSSRGFSNQITRLAAAAEALASTPESGANRLAVIGAVQDLTKEIGAGAGAIQTLRGDADREVKATVESINADLATLERINGELGRSHGSPELLDRRDATLAGLAEKIEISVLSGQDGKVSVYTRGGQPLLEDGARSLRYTPAAQVSAGSSFGPIEVFRPDQLDPQTGEPKPGTSGAVLVTGGVRGSPTPESEAAGTELVRSPLTAGRLQGLIEARDRLLPELHDQVVELASVATFALNAAHNASTSTSPPAALNGTRTEFGSFTTATRSGTAYLAVVNRTGGGTARTVAVTMAGATPNDIVDQINAGLGGLGAASIAADGSLQVRLNDPGQGLTVAEGSSSIAVTDQAGRTLDYGFSHYFGLNDLVVPGGDGPGDLAVRAGILANSGQLATGRLTVAAGPPAVATLGGAGDNRGAQALAAALERDVPTVGRGSLSGGPATIGQYAASLVSAAAVRAEQTDDARAGDAAVVDELAFRQSSTSGVNVDEELSRLVLYQQAYSVSARVVSITNDLFDELLNLAR